MTRRIRILAAALFLGALSGCGGGGADKAEPRSADDTPGPKPARAGPPAAADDTARPAAGAAVNAP